MLENCHNSLITHQNFWMDAERDLAKGVIVIVPVHIPIRMLDQGRSPGRFHSPTSKQVLPTTLELPRLCSKEHNVVGNLHSMFSGNRLGLSHCTPGSAFVSAPFYLRLLAGNPEGASCRNAKYPSFHCSDEPQQPQGFE